MLGESPESSGGRISFKQSQFFQLLCNSELGVCVSENQTKVAESFCRRFLQEALLITC
jgi:hypothetical protein